MAEEETISELTQEVEALKDVSKDLAELLTNSVNMVDKYYEIFFDQNPHYVELEQYDKNGILRTTLIPNRAMDKTVAFSGEEDPEGVVDAVMGALYVNSITRELFMKKTAEGNIGWANITPQPIEIYKETFKVNSETQRIQLVYKAYAKDYIDVFLNGRHLEQADFDLDTDRQTLIFNTQFPDYSTLQVKYLTGLYGIKGDTALTLRIGEVKTVSAGEPAKVENVGTGEDIVLDFDIPKGDTGANSVHVGPHEPIDGETIWIDTSAEGYKEDELSVSRIFDSGNNTNPIAYNKAYNMMHSSIDTTKYATFGNVHIDDNGILVALSNNSGIRTPVKLSQMLNKNWSISGRDYLDAEVGTHQYFFVLGAINGMGCSFYFRNSDHSFQYIDRNSGDNVVLFNNSEVYGTYGKGWYNWRVEFKDGIYYFYISYGSNPNNSVVTDEDYQWTYEDEYGIDTPLALRLKVAHANFIQPADGYVYISADSIYNYSQSKSNLSVFNVSVDGFTVFTPNVTEVYSICDDDFTKVGNPYITDNGVLTRVANGTHYIYSDFTADKLLDKSWEIDGELIHVGSTEVLWQFADPNNIETVSTDEDPLSGDHTMLSAKVDASTNKLIFYLMTGISTAHSEIHDFEFDIEVGKEYFYKFIYEVSGNYKIVVSTDANFENNVEEQTYIAYTVNKNPYVSNVFPAYKLVIGTNNTISDESIVVHNDLNYFKVSIMGSLEYRPLLRVPYTLSKYGAKFAEPRYQNRLEEAYKIHGKGDIFVLNTETRAVTLPLVDIYSLMAPENTKITYGKGLEYDKVHRVLDNLVEGLEIGDIGMAPYVDESLGLRKICNGQVINIDNNTTGFLEYVKSLRSVGLVVTEAEWQAEAAQGDCNKFVISSNSSSATKNYYAYIPDSFIIRTPVISDDEDPEHSALPKIYCTNCGTELKYDQPICTVCYTVNDRYTGVDTNHLEGSNITESDIVNSQEGVTPPTGGDGEPTQPDNPEITYIESVSSELTEADIIYTTSQDPLAENTLFKKVNNIIYPVTNVALTDVLDENKYHRYDTADFSQEVQSEEVNYVRIPKLSSGRGGYVMWIQIATGVNNQVNVENTYEVATPYAYGMYQYADVDINCPGWLLSDGTWYSGKMYPTFYNWIKANAEGRNRAKWVQPIFSSNTYRAFGGAIYTVSASHASGASQPYRVFNGSLEANNEWWTNHGVTSAENPCWWQMHSTVALVFKKITIMNENSSPANFKTGYVQVSHDGTNWKNVCIMNGIDTPETGAGNPGGLVPITIDWNNTIDSFTTEEINLGFNYLRLYFTASFNASGLSIQLLDIEAEQTYLDKFKKVNNPAYSVTEYDFVINEENYTFRLPLLANACDYSKMRFLVDSQASTTGDHRWFNLYSDGWLEQGGDYTAGNTSNGWSGYITITFPKPFKSNVYNIDLGSHQLRDGNYGTGTELTNILPQSIRIRTYNRVGETRTYKAMGYTNPPAFDTYRHLFPRLYYYVGDTVQTRKEMNMAELANQIAILQQRIEALGG